MSQLGASILLTFRELWAMRITQAIIVVTTIAWLLLVFAMNLDVVEGSIAALRIFGLDSAPTQPTIDPATGEFLRNPETGRIVQEALTLERFALGINSFVVGASYFFGTLLGLFATMPLVNGFVEQGRIDLMLSKPVSRPRLLSGHIVGVWTIVLLLVTYLVGAVWTVVSFKTGLWIPRFLIAIPFIVVMFGVMYAIVLAIGVASRSTGLALVVAYGCMFFSGILAARDQIVPQLGKVAAAVFLGLYHLLPNYIEVIGLMSQLVEGESVNSWYPLISSLLFGVVVYAVAYVVFSRKDY